jgi:hypothetical protein
LVKSRDRFDAGPYRYGGFLDDITGSTRHSSVSRRAKPRRWIRSSG